MIISEQELQRRLNSQNNLAVSLSIDSSDAVALEEKVEVINIPKREQTPQVKDAGMRIVAGVLAHTQTIKSVAQELNLTPNQVKSAKNSVLIAPARNNAIDRVRELALDKLVQALNLMDEEKFTNADLKTLSRTAAEMSRVVEKLSDKREESSTKLVIYAPSLKAERNYGEIEI
jgi:hypothetical protein